MVKKQLLALACMISLAAVTTMSECKPILEDWKLMTIAALTPLVFRLCAKDPQMEPTFDYTWNSGKKEFWTFSNAWNIYDQWLIGQMLQLKSVKLDPYKLKFQKLDCPPTGVLGILDAYILGCLGKGFKLSAAIFAFLHTDSFFNYITKKEFK